MFEKNEEKTSIKKKKGLVLKVVLFLLVTFMVSGAVVSIVVASLFQPVSSDNKELVRFVVPRGQSVIVVADRLAENNLIKNSKLFQIFYRLNEDKYNIQAGSFELSQTMSLTEVLETLSDGADDVWITFPEGVRREEIAQSLLGYDLVNFDMDEFLLQTVGMEGKLFPDTYLVPKEITTQALISLMNNTFEKKIALLADDVKKSEYSVDELIVIASLLEREAKGLDQMKRVAGVIFKRLQLGMPLQVDATLQYAKGFNEQTGTWWSTPLAADKEIDSRYNTYQNPGLPPAPICNPGFEALEASVNPLYSDYLYYIHDSAGQIHFGRTLQEHNQNINNYLR